MGLLSQPRMNHVQVAAVRILVSLDNASKAEDTMRQFKIMRAAIAPDEIPDLFPSEVTQKSLVESMEDGTISDADVPWTIPATDAEREELESLLSEVHNFSANQGGDTEWQ